MSSNLLLSVVSIYSFIFAGFVLKKSFKEKIHEQTLTLLVVYLLSPILVFWGFMLRPIDKELLLAPTVFFIVSMLAFAIIYLFSKRIFADKKERSIANAAPLIGNTGNIGIPLCIMLLGEESIPYTNAINLVNIFFVYVLGVFFYSLGSFSVRQSFFNIAKMPVIWSAILALSLNLFGITLDKNIFKALEMGAYSSMAIQLILFGTFLYSATFTTFSKKLFFYVFGVKFFFIPALALVFLLSFSIDKYIAAIIFLELSVPLAITNATLATLYDCKPKELTAHIFYSTLFFLPYSFFVFWIVEKVFKI